MTAQMGEILVVDGERMHMAFCPPLPVKSGHVRATPDDEVGDGYSTACWRGYVATWEIEDGVLYLKAIDGPGFGIAPRWRMSGEERVSADWFSGVLRVPRGRQLHYVHMGFSSVYEEELHFKIANGRVVAQRVVDNRGKEPSASRLGLPGSENDFDGDDW